MLLEFVTNLTRAHISRRCYLTLTNSRSKIGISRVLMSNKQARTFKCCQVVECNMNLKEYILRQTGMKCGDYLSIVYDGKRGQGSHV